MASERSEELRGSILFYRRGLDLLLGRLVQQAIELGALEAEYGHPHRAARRRLFDDWRLVRSAMAAIWPHREASQLTAIEELLVGFELADGGELPGDRMRMRVAFYTLYEFFLDVAVEMDTMIRRSAETA
ncbi:MAG: hypothetical protein NXI31_17690 [bacterium]|nr:hypothetical protein [bacterium]